jgi:fibronectin type 3 domain-containing protein
MANSPYSDTAVNTGSSYRYYVIAHYPEGNLRSPSSATVEPGATPDVPVGLYYFSGTSGEVRLSWSPVSRAQSYSIYRSSTLNGTYSHIQTVGGHLNNIVTGHTDGVALYYKVSAIIGQMESAQSTAIAAYSSDTPAAPIAAIQGNGSIQITWNSSPLATSYTIERSVDSIHFSVLNSNVTSTSYTDTSPVATRPHVYRITPQNGSISFTRSLPSDPVYPSIPPLTPMQLSARLIANDDVYLTWVESPNVANYRIYKSSVSGGPYTLLATLPSGQNEYIDVPPSTEGESTYYVVTARNASSEESSYSNQASIQKTDGPTGLAATGQQGYIAVSWNALAGASAYRVYRSTASGGPYSVISSSTASLSLQDTDVDAGRTYYYRVASLMSNGQLSRLSSEVSAVGIRSLDLVVPIEMIDVPVFSSTQETVITRSLSSIDSSAYDGNVTSFFEVVARNSDSVDYPLHLLNESDAIIASVTVPAGTLVPTRFEVPFTLESGRREYRVLMPATTSSNLVHLTAARMIIVQTNATRTQIYIPLLNATPSLNLGAQEPIFSTSQITHQVPATSYPWKKDTSSYSQLDDNQPWELEIVASNSGEAVGSVSLINSSIGSSVAETEIEIHNSQTTLIRSAFSNTASGFASPTHEGSTFRIGTVCKFDCDRGSISLYKAGLWLRLQNLSKVEIVQRIAIASSLTQGIQSHSSYYSRINSSRFMNTQFALEVYSTSSHGFLSRLKSHGSSDSSQSQSSPVAASELSIPIGASTTRSSFWSPGDSDYRYSFESEMSSGSTTLHEARFIIRSTR